MARYTEPTEEQERLWQEWLDERPPNVKAVAERFDPWTLYRLKTTNQRVFVNAFDEDSDGVIKCRVGVSGEFNFLSHERNVFGINPNDLIECDLPKEGELLGSLEIPDEMIREALKGGEI